MTEPTNAGDTQVRARALEEALHRVEQIKTYYLGENPGHRFPIPHEIKREYREAIRALAGKEPS